jgi:hypothetical protein
LETVREGGMGENYFQIQNTEKFENQKGDWKSIPTPTLDENRQHLVYLYKHW